MVEGWLDDEDRAPRREARAPPHDDARAAAEAEARALHMVCARCHSLTHNGCDSHLRRLHVHAFLLVQAVGT